MGMGMTFPKTSEGKGPSFVIRAVLAVVAALAGLVVLAKRRFRRQVRREVAKLFAQAGAGLGPEDLRRREASLPEPVRQHLRNVISEGAPALRTAQLRHDGTFRFSPRQPWRPIQGQQYFTVEPPGFLWNATIRLAPALWVEARDCLLEGRGSMLVKINSTLTVADAQGPDMDQGSTMRWLAETVWFPYGFLSERITWEPIDERSARATLRDGGPPVSLVFTLEGGTFGTVSGNRYYEPEGRVRPWKGCCRDYRGFSGFRVPSSIEVSWELDDGDFSYAQFQLSQLEYNVAFPVRKEAFVSRNRSALA